MDDVERTRDHSRGEGEEEEHSNLSGLLRLVEQIIAPVVISMYSIPYLSLLVVAVVAVGWTDSWRGSQRGLSNSRCRLALLTFSTRAE